MGTAGAPKKPGTRRRLRIDLYVYVRDDNKSRTYTGDVRMDRFLDWFDNPSFVTRTTMVRNLLIAATNGELGVAPVASMGGDEGSEKNQSALNELLLNMGVEEE